MAKLSNEELLNLSGTAEPHYSRKVSPVPLAQNLWNQGMLWLSGFCHAESRRIFKAVIEIDPNCALAFWGVALSYAPHFNYPLCCLEHSIEALKALNHALQLKTSVIERKLLEAQKLRFSADKCEDRKHLDDAYCSAMRALSREFPEVLVASPLPYIFLFNAPLTFP